MDVRFKALLLLACVVQIDANTPSKRTLETLLKRLIAKEKRQSNQVVYATCELQPNSQGTSHQTLSGTIHLLKRPFDDVRIYGEVRGFSEAGSLHGFHIHESSDPDNNCDNNGGNYNPHGLNHGGPSDVERHVGDLGNIEVCADGVARVKTRDSLVELDGQYSVIGRSIVDLPPPPPVLTSNGDHRNTYCWQSSGKHPTGMLSCTLQVHIETARPKYPKAPKKCPSQKRDKDALMDRLRDALSNLLD